MILILMGAAAYMTFFERVVMARMQLRLGPNRVGPLGLLQPIADGIKLLFKESFQPAGVDKFTYWLAPAISLFTALFAFVLIPVGGTVDIFGYPCQAANCRCQCRLSFSARLFLACCLWRRACRLVLQQPLFPFGRLARHSPDDQLRNPHGPLAFDSRA